MFRRPEGEGRPWIFHGYFTVARPRRDDSASSGSSAGVSASWLMLLRAGVPACPGHRDEMQNSHVLNVDPRVENKIVDYYCGDSISHIPEYNPEYPFELYQLYQETATCQQLIWINSITEININSISIVKLP